MQELWGDLGRFSPLLSICYGTAIFAAIDRAQATDARLGPELLARGVQERSAFCVP